MPTPKISGHASPSFTYRHARIILSISFFLLILSYSASLAIARTPADALKQAQIPNKVEQPGEQVQANLKNVMQPAATDWPQVQNNPQRTGYTAEALGTNFTVVWTHPFQPEKIFPQVQAIVHANKVFVGTEMGKLYALDAASGAQIWVFSVGAPILNSVAAGNGRVFFGAMDGDVYALDASTGGVVWRTALSWRTGFSTAPVFAENKIMLGGRDGSFYALDADNGQVLWHYDVGAPILQTAAWDGGRVFFGAMDMHVYAINTSDGTLAWKSEKLPGMAFKDYWPVIHQGYVYIRPMGRGGLGVSDRALVTDPAEQQTVLDSYEQNPSGYTLNMFRLDAITGNQAPPIIHYNGQTMNGATSPPCVDRDGYLIVPAPYFSGFKTGWGRLNPGTRMLDQLLFDGTETGFGNTDENMNLTCAVNLILAMHTEEYNAHFTGAFDLDHNTWIQILPGHTLREMSTNTQGGGGNPASVANGFVFHITYHELVARTTH